VGLAGACSPGPTAGAGVAVADGAVVVAKGGDGERGVAPCGRTVGLTLEEPGCGLATTTTGELFDRLRGARTGGDESRVSRLPLVTAALPVAARSTDATVATGNPSALAKVLPSRIGKPSGGSMTPGSAFTSIGRVLAGDPGSAGASGARASRGLIRT
jgi:hypothetical protein